MLVQHGENEVPIGLGVAADPFRRPVGVVINARDRRLPMKARVGMMDVEAEMVKLLGRDPEPELGDDLAHRERPVGQAVVGVVPLEARAPKPVELQLQSLPRFLSERIREQARQERARGSGHLQFLQSVRGDAQAEGPDSELFRELHVLALDVRVVPLPLLAIEGEVRAPVRRDDRGEGPELLGRRLHPERAFADREEEQEESFALI